MLPQAKPEIVKQDRTNNQAELRRIITGIRRGGIGFLGALLAAGCQSAGSESLTQGPGPKVSLDSDARQAVEVQLPESQVRFTLAPVPGGTIDGRRVEPFWMATTEVPWQDYLELVFEVEDRLAAEAADGYARPSRPYISIDRGFGQQTRPVISVSARGAKAWCEYLTRKSGTRFRLPTLDEWRLAAIGGGFDASQAVGRETTDARTAPVASLPANRLGIHDLVGNAAEWALDRGAAVVLGGSYREPRAQLSPLALERPSAAWNRSDPQIPKSTWWLADAGFPGIRVVVDQPPAMH